MFKKAIIAAAMLSALSFNVAQAADGSINFTGKIIATTCDIGAGSGDEKVNVAMGSYGANAFAATGSTVANVPFSIDLSKCDDSIKQAKVLFEGTADGTNNKLIKLTGTKPATGVGIGLYESNGTAIELGKASALQTVTGGNAKLGFIAKYVATKDKADITSGDANGTTQFTIQYP
ncbi:fimbrial protein [Ewingella americana]|uniref:fimbrial protein n=1 Tax=Ewingella americana TaxID=41202 RepID=UPI0012ADEE56|nr:fimbrial protein [Ewingella americana]MRT05946.1 fimbrial protein [Ewingella americana]